MILNTYGKISVLKAHKLLGLVPRFRSIKKEEIQQAYLTSAKRYHPDSRGNANASPCAVSFRQCHEARDVLLRYYAVSRSPGPRAAFKSNNASSATSSAFSWREKSYHPLSFLQHSRARKFTFTLKALVLFAAACDGMHERRKQSH